MIIDANAWGSGILGAVIGSSLTVWLTKLESKVSEGRERFKYLDIVVSQLGESIAQAAPALQGARNFVVWPSRGCSIAGAIIQNSLFSRPQDVDLLAQLRKLHASIEDYNSHRQMAVSIVAASVPAIGDALPKNIEATYTVMLQQFTVVTSNAVVALKCALSLRDKEVSLWDKIKAFITANRSEAP